MHPLINKKIRVYFYIFLLLLFSTFYNNRLSYFFDEQFKIKIIDEQPETLKNIEFNNLIDKNIFYINKKYLKSLIDENPVFKSFEVKKIFPNKLKINYVKTRAVAKITSDENPIYLGDNQKLFKSSKPYDSIPEIIGKVDLKIINKIIQNLNSSPFTINKIKFIKIYPTNRFDLIFNNQKIIKFPVNYNQKILKHAFNIYNDNNFKKNVIDLRLENKIILYNE